MKLCLLACSALIAIPTASSMAHAQYADPPDDPTVVGPGPGPLHPDRTEPGYYGSEDRYAPSSVVRILTGPALRVSDRDPAAGLFAAVDAGSGPAGLRLSGRWVGAGGPSGLSEYTAELWLDLAHGSRLHPIVGAGAGLARVEPSPDSAGEDAPATVGVGVLRATFQYELPVEGTDARVGLDATGSLPAVGSDRTEGLPPWALLVATVAVGF